MSGNLAVDKASGESPAVLKTDTRRVRRGVSATWAEMRRAWQAYALLAPTFLILIVFVYYPPILGLIRSFYEWAPGTDATFVGFSNFRAYFAYPETQREMLNMGKLLLFGLFSNMVVPFLMAELIFSVRSAVAKEFYRLLIIIPMLTPGLVTILLWKHMYDPKFGPIHTLLRSSGLDMLARNWLGEPSTALYAVMAVGLLQHAPGNDPPNPLDWNGFEFAGLLRRGCAGFRLDRRCGGRRMRDRAGGEVGCQNSAAAARALGRRRKLALGKHPFCQRRH